MGNEQSTPAPETDQAIAPDTSTSVKKAGFPSSVAEEGPVVSEQPLPPERVNLQKAGIREPVTALESQKENAALVRALSTSPTTVTPSARTRSTKKYLTSEQLKHNPGLNSVVNDKRKHQLGSKGREVKLIQQRLIDIREDLGKRGADGIFGPKTEEAVKRYQKSRGLVVDGKVGSTTLVSLDGSNQPIDIFSHQRIMNAITGYNATRKKEATIINISNDPTIDPLLLSTEANFATDYPGSDPLILLAEANFASNSNSNQFDPYYYPQKVVVGESYEIGKGKGKAEFQVTSVRDATVENNKITIDNLGHVEMEIKFNINGKTIVTTRTYEAGVHVVQIIVDLEEEYKKVLNKINKKHNIRNEKTAVVNALTTKPKGISHSDHDISIINNFRRFVVWKGDIIKTKLITYKVISVNNHLNGTNSIRRDGFKIDVPYPEKVIMKIQYNEIKGKPILDYTLSFGEWDLERMSWELHRRYHFRHSDRKRQQLLVSFILDMIPYISTAKAIIELSTGKELVTGDKLTDFQYYMTIAALIPWGKLFGKAFKLLLEQVRSKFISRILAGKSTSDAIEEASELITDAFNKKPPVTLETVKIDDVYVVRNTLVSSAELIKIQSNQITKRMRALHRNPISDIPELRKPFAAAVRATLKTIPKYFKDFKHQMDIIDVFGNPNTWSTLNGDYLKMLNKELRIAGDMLYNRFRNNLWKFSKKDADSVGFFSKNGTNFTTEPAPTVSLEFFGKVQRRRNKAGRTQDSFSWKLQLDHNNKRSDFRIEEHLESLSGMTDGDAKVRVIKILMEYFCGSHNLHLSIGLKNWLREKWPEFSDLLESSTNLPENIMNIPENIIIPPLLTK